jgi:hypothetical protein
MITWSSIYTARYMITWNRVDYILDWILKENGEEEWFYG